MAESSLHIDVDFATADDVAAWLRGVSDVASALARNIRDVGAPDRRDLAGALERVAEEAHSAAREAQEVA